MISDMVDRISDEKTRVDRYQAKVSNSIGFTYKSDLLSFKVVSSRSLSCVVLSNSFSWKKQLYEVDI
jgi:hypothetical protein